MPIKKAAFKHLWQTKRRTERNKAVKVNIRSLLKQVRTAVEQQKQEEATTLARAAVKAIDKAAQHGVVKKNAAARKKSRLMRRVNAMAQPSS